MIFSTHPDVRSLGVDGKIMIVTFHIRCHGRLATWNAINSSIIKSAKIARMLS